MANTYTQLYIHFVFAVKNRKALIAKSWRDELEKYITGTVQDEGHKMLAIKTRPDHAHIFIGYKPTQLIPKLIETIKRVYCKYSCIKNVQVSPYGRHDGGV
jgi:putative transposase